MAPEIENAQIEGRPRSSSRSVRRLSGCGERRLALAAARIAEEG
jgi:hypothetical protein